MASSSRPLNTPPTGPSSTDTPTSSSNSNSPAIEDSTDSNDGTEPMLRRGHSDGEVLTIGMGPYSSMMLGSSGGQGETLQDFLRQIPGSQEDQLERTRAAVRRAAMVAADRKRRLQETREDINRRRSYTAGYSIPPPGVGDRRSTGLRPSIGASAALPPVSLDVQNTRVGAERPLPRIPSFGSPHGSHQRDFAPPRWQPDSEVSECPICGRAFAFWYRKHHCRKCGRVVCASCSPHRITIPRQFIVHPPSDPDSGMVVSPTNVEVIDLTGDDTQSGSTTQPSTQGRPQSRDYRLDPALGGGQEVRLCNPCVPDPNPLPPPTYPPTAPRSFTSFPQPESIPSISQAPRRPSRAGVLDLSSNPPTPQQLLLRDNPPDSVDVASRRHTLQSNYRPPPGLPAPRINDTRPTYQPPDNRVPFHYPGSTAEHRAVHHAARFNPQFPPPSFPQTPYGSAPGPSFHNIDRHQLYGLPPQPNLSQPPRDSVSAPRPHPHRSHHRYHASTSDVPSGSRYRSMLDISTPIPPPPQLREEDECPICHLALPPKSPNGEETAREAHVASCIETHFSSSAPRSSHPPPGAAIAGAVAANAMIPAQAGSSAGPATIRPEPTQVVSESSVARRRTTGMVVYHASEKDCIGGDGAVQECVICFEEFAVGDEMGRLECLCKFHKVCIRQWWDTKGPGSCPSHQGGL